MINMQRLNYIENPKYMVFSDFDGTYLSHEMSNSDKSELRDLEAFLLCKSEELKIMFGFVTGSNEENLKMKMKKFDLKVLPHFIASSLGTELSHECKRTQGIKDEIFEREMLSNYSIQDIEKVRQELARHHGIQLIPQNKGNDSRFKISFYLSPCSDEIRKKIQEEAMGYGLKANVSRCDPSVGDPEGSYDVDFIPKTAGKQRIVEFLCQKHKVAKVNSYAFGNSENDLSMLKSVRNGYWVGNAMDCAVKNSHFPVTSKSYTGGILEVISRLY